MGDFGIPGDLGQVGIEGPTGEVGSPGPDGTPGRKVSILLSNHFVPFERVTY